MTAATYLNIALDVFDVQTNVHLIPEENKIKKANIIIAPVMHWSYFFCYEDYR